MTTTALDANARRILTIADNNAIAIHRQTRGPRPLTSGLVRQRVQTALDRGYGIQAKNVEVEMVLAELIAGETRHDELQEAAIDRIVNDRFTTLFLNLSIQSSSLSEALESMSSAVREIGKRAPKVASFYREKITDEKLASAWSAHNVDLPLEVRGDVEVTPEQVDQLVEMIDETRPAPTEEQFQEILAGGKKRRKGTKGYIIAGESLGFVLVSGDADPKVRESWKVA